MARTLTLLLTLLLASWTLSGQTSIDALREQIKKAEAEIKRQNELLQKTQKDKQVNQTQLKIVEGRIRSRREVVTTLEKQLALLQDEINEKGRTVGEMTAGVEQLKTEYADMIREAYKNYKLNNFALFLFAAADFNDASRRMEYMRRYNKAREAKARELRAYTDSLSGQIALLDAQRHELDSTRSIHSTELSSLRKDESQYSKSLTQLKQQESKITKEVKAKQQQIQKAQNEIQRLIAEEAKKNQTEKRTAAEDKYIAELSGKFGDNKGKLPYPVRGGVVIDRYGTHPHPTQRGLTVNNKGVNIAGERGSDVTCVFEGSVSKVFVIPGYNNCVMVRHGDYITLYANLASVNVKAGDKLSLNQRVGRLSDSNNSDDVFLHFEVWKETTNLNPEQWLHR